MKVIARLAMILLLAVGVVGAVGHAAADTAKAENARELFRVFQADGIMEQMMDAALTQMNTMTRQMNPELPTAASEIIQQEVQAALKESMPLLIEEVAKIYERVFSEEELDAMLAFYKSPVGQSMIKKMPQMSGETMRLSQQWAMGLIQNLPARVEQRLREEGYDL